MQHGTLRARYIRCGKPNCRCAVDLEARHGPYWYLVWRQGRRLRMRYIPPRAVNAVQAAIDARRALETAIRDCKRDIRLWKDGRLEEWMNERLENS
ncbi:MAG: DUF6788 family protein [Armatimonadota bacterium]